MADNHYGLCSVRKNQDGVLKTINYGEVTSIALDPIEKKPLYHFKPGKNVLSVGSFGCNFKCSFCQNHIISQNIVESRFLPPDELVQLANGSDNNIGIAFTYNEPTIWYEYVYDTAKLLKNKYPHLKTVLVSNGYISLDPLKDILPFIDAINIDLKFFDQENYKKITSGDLNEVIKTIEIAYKSCHIEITTLLIDNLNDSPDEVERIASFIAGLDRNIPLHLSRYYPSFKMNRPPTDIKKIIENKDAAKKHLNYVYIGNIPHTDNSTFCPRCNKLLVDRKGYYTRTLVDDSTCPSCEESISVEL